MINLDVNPFADIASFGITTETMQYYIIAMVILVVGGTIIDMVHKKSAKYFFENAKKAQKNATREVSGSEKIGIAVKTIVEDVALSGEFCNIKRRIAHLLTMYGFIVFVATTAAIAFSTNGNTSELLALIWHIGAIMLAVGSWWFWLFIRVDVVAEGNKRFKIAPMDLFSLSLMATSVFALIWSFSDNHLLAFAFFIASSTLLFGSVLWSKFAHMFFKPAAAFNKRMTKADGSRENLPEKADRTSSADTDRHSMLLLKDAPLNMGLGIKRAKPKNY